MMRIGFLAAMAAVAWVGTAGQSRAGFITQAGFSGGATLVNFDSLVAVPPTGPFNIGSVSFSESSTGSGGPGWRMFNNGSTPVGTTGNFITDNAGISNIQVDFSTVANRAGLFVLIGGTYQVNFFTTGFALLASTTITNPITLSSTFVGYESFGAPITRIQILETSGDNALVGGLDDVRFEPAGPTPSAVPEPASMLACLLGVATAGVARVRRRRAVAAV